MRRTSPAAGPLICPGSPLGQVAAEPSEDTEADIADERARRWAMASRRPAATLEAAGWAARWGALWEAIAKSARGASAAAIPLSIGWLAVG